MFGFLSHVVRVLGTWFGCGLTGRAPGTFGTLGAIPLWWCLSGLHPFAYMFAVLIFSASAMVVAGLYEAEVEGKHDLPEFVMDEVAGFLVTMTWVPASFSAAAAGFALFRLFDIWKPFPISWMDRRIPGGVGTVADDLAAGILANVVLQLMLQNGVL